MTREEITASEASQLLTYLPTSGAFAWKVSRGGQKAGTIAGHEQQFRSGHRYRVIRIGCLHLTHRLVWLFETGSFPPGLLDHRNGDTLDNRFENLREATQSQNMQNTRRRTDNTSTFKGVSWDRINGKWVARIRAPGGPYRNLGRFTFAEEAHAAYQHAAEALFGEFARAA